MIPWVLKAYGPGWALRHSGILMAIATIVFWMGRGFTSTSAHRQDRRPGFMPVRGRRPARRSARRAGFSAALGVPPDVDAAKAAWEVFKLFAAVSIFWALFDHTRLVVVFAQQMDQSGASPEASQISALNPIMVMGLIPVFSK